MALWPGIAVLGLVMVGVVLRRIVRQSARRSADLGEVSQSWLNEQKASKDGERI
jgi:hypothetical protein